MSNDAMTHWQPRVPRADDDRDPLELDVFEVLTRQRLVENDGCGYPTPFCCYMHRVDGEKFEVAYETVEALAAFIAEFAPVDCVFYVGAQESAEDLKGAISAAIARRTH